MKKALFILSCFTAIYAQSQVKLGVKAGVNLSSMAFDSFSESNGINDFNYETKTGASVGFQAEGFVEFALTNDWSLEAGLAYTQHKTNLKYRKETEINTWGDVLRTRNIDFPSGSKSYLGLINLPVWLKYNVKNFRPKAGFSLGYAITNFKQKEDNKKTVGKMDSKLDFTLGLGAEYKLYKGLFIDANYNFGLANMYFYDDWNFKNRYLIVGLGYKF